MRKHPFNKSLNCPRKGMETSPSNSPTASSFMKTLGLSTLAVFAMAAAAQAVLIDMQFSSVGTGNPAQTGAAVVGTAGDIWNHSGNAAGTLALNNVAGTSSGVSLTWSGGAGGVFNVNPSNSGFNGTQWAPLMSNYLYSSSSATVSLALTGLNSSLTYDLYLYTQPSKPVNTRQVAFTATGLTTTGPVTTALSNPNLNYFLEGTNYVKFSGLAPTVGGDLTITYTTPNEADFNGFQIQSVPEPGTWALLALTGTVFMVMRPRRRD